ncbi:MAG: type II toxin-antitoxin system prevent-host-death family antitoxin [Pseudomonadota bacterium]
MKTVGIRDLKNNLSEHLRDVRRGETVLVTDRGNVIAEIAPPGYGKSDPSIPAGIAALARRGLMTVGAAGGQPLYRTLPRLLRGKVSARQLLDEERGSR